MFHFPNHRKENFVKDVAGAITGSTAARAARRAGELQFGATQEAAEGFQPFQELGQQGIEQAGFLTDPTAQFEFLQNNPLFQMALEQAQTGTQNVAASRGRLSAGDTLQQLSQNVLTAASPLISGQKQSISDLLNVGFGAQQNIGDLITGGGAARAAGEVGAASARGQGARNILNIGASALLAGGAFPGGGGGSGLAKAGI